MPSENGVNREEKESAEKSVWIKFIEKLLFSNHMHICTLRKQEFLTLTMVENEKSKNKEDSEENDDW